MRLAGARQIMPKLDDSLGDEAQFNMDRPRPNPVALGSKAIAIRSSGQHRMLSNEGVHGSEELRYRTCKWLKSDGNMSELPGTEVPDIIFQKF
ncbi:Uncharacterized protein TCM_005433 [Theobroma cacao]|uniref:Uncharacterized protein n=1 Tax=Theobroma cacao TaxID=3641 RepID=A0A061DVL6_THECC|nr:Uncharacterized protein TCM_005433 [Theobroma cacao]